MRLAGYHWGTVAEDEIVLWYGNSVRPSILPWKKRAVDTPSGPRHGRTVDLDRDGDADIVMAVSGAGRIA